jgi:hypothetical protein
MTLSGSDVGYLEVVEKTSFEPVGWLYRSIYDDLAERGLVSRTRHGGFILSDDGARALVEHRKSEGASSP